MATRSSLEWLQRHRILAAPQPGGGQFGEHALNSHFRPIVPLSELKPLDTPARRVLTQKEEDRLPFTSDYQI